MRTLLDPKAGRSRTFTQSGYITRGAYQGFKVHLKDRTEVSVSSVADIIDWLFGCGYRRDFVDEWQRPSQFEKTRLGDDEDYALWAWVKLIELGYDAELHLGHGPYSKTRYRRVISNVWVSFTDETGAHKIILLLVTPDRGPLIVYEDYTTDYRPWFAIDAEGRKYRYGLPITDVWNWIMRRKV